MHTRAGFCVRGILVLFCISLFPIAAFSAGTEPAAENELESVAALSAEPEPAAENGLEPEYDVPAGTRIRAIRINVRDVFDSERSFFHRLANAFHWTSTEGSVRRDLLYKEGDIYRQDIVDESERNLRATGRFRVERTQVVFAEGEEGCVDLVINIWDVWSLYTNINPKLSGGLFLFKFTIGEKNFLGEGMSLELNVERDNFFWKWHQQFDEPRLFRSRWRVFERFGFQYDTEGNHVGENLGFIIERPLFSRSEKWGWQTSLSYENGPVIKNEGGAIKQVEVEDGVFRDRRYHSRDLTLINHLVRSFGYTNKLNVGVYIRNDQRRYRAYDGLEPEYEDSFREKVMKDDYTRHKLGVSIAANNYRWIRLRGFKNYGVVEDFALGSSASASVSTARKFWGSSENGWYVSLVLTNNTILPGNQIMQPSASFTSDFVAGQGQRDMITTLRYLHHFRGVPLGTLSLRAEASFGERLSSDNTLTLGADTGLRGYVSDRFEGDRRMLFSVEYRFDPLPFISNPYIAFVAFGDFGSCWYNQGHGLRDARVYPGAGIGLRISLPGVESDAWRLDFATNFGNDKSTFGSIFSLSYSQAF